MIHLVALILAFLLVVGLFVLCTLLVPLCHVNVRLLLCVCHLLPGSTENSTDLACEKVGVNFAMRTRLEVSGDLRRRYSPKVA